MSIVHIHEISTTIKEIEETFETHDSHAYLTRIMYGENNIVTHIHMYFPYHRRFSSKYPKLAQNMYTKGVIFHHPGYVLPPLPTSTDLRKLSRALNKSCRTNSNIYEILDDFLQLLFKHKHITPSQYKNFSDRDLERFLYKKFLHNQLDVHNAVDIGIFQRGIENTFLCTPLLQTSNYHDDTELFLKLENCSEGLNFKYLIE